MVMSRPQGDEVTVDGLEVGPKPLGTPESARLDVALVTAGWFESRAKAREAIEAGLVTLDGVVVSRPASRIRTGAHLAATAPYPWVSRGGVKLGAALGHFGIEPRGRVCLDVGASTGGFTDVLLARGAARVHAVDVGHGQLHPRIAADPRVSDWSGTDIRMFDAGRLSERPTLLVCDVSFISLSLVIGAILALAAPAADLVALIKPQFEVGKGNTVKGIVRSETLRAAVCDAASAEIVALGWTLAGLTQSPIRGGDGNVEFLVAARRP